VIADKLKVLALSEIKEIKKESAREDATSLIILRKWDIEATFTENEYLKIDFTNGEILGLKSHAMLGTMPIGDLPAMNYVIARDEKYKDADMLNLGNVSDLYEKIEI
jgi:hypothetical protein